MLMSMKEVFGYRKWACLRPSATEEIERIYRKILNRLEILLPDSYLTPFAKDIVVHALSAEDYYAPLLDYMMEHRFPAVSQASLILSVQTLVRIRQYAVSRMKDKPDHGAQFAITALNKCLAVLELMRDGCGAY